MKPASNDHEEELKKSERISYLIFCHLNNTLTPEESDELDNWVSASDENLELFEKLTDEDNIEAGIQQYLQLEKQKAAAWTKVKEGTGLLPAKKSILQKITPYLVAAAVVMIAASIYMLKTGTGNKNIEKPLVQNQVQDIAPGTDKAVLSLADGRTVILDATGNGAIANNDGVKVTKQNGGELRYQPSSDAQPLTFHTLSIPRGGKYNLQLPDGSMIWLNAESSIRYPVNFTGNTRAVELKGEAYFEIAKNEKSPFTVKTISSAGEEQVKVLGTHFNINGYGDDGSTKTSLLEGMVQVEKNGIEKVLKPGEQAVSATTIKVIKTDVHEAIAWKEGKFLFRNATIKTIGEQIKRWYDVEVVYGGNISQHFNTEMSRNLPLSRLLDGLEGTMQVHFKLEEKKLTITP